MPTVTTFTKAAYSNKTGLCRRLAAHIAAAAAAMDLVASLDPSRQSASHYVYVSADSEGEDQIKIRCSDHPDRHGGSDWHAWSDACPSLTIARLAAHFGRAVPSGYRPGDYAARSIAAQAAAATRGRAKRATEKEMSDAVAGAMTAAPSSSPVAAGKMVDRLYPGIPRAQRQRIAQTVSSIVSRDRAIAAAARNEAALVSLAARYAEARVALLDLVGADRFAGLRPAGCPRTLWKV